MKATAEASFVRLQTMADGTPRMIIDLACSLADIAQFNLVPGAPILIARMDPGAAKEHQQQKMVGGPLSKEAAGLCKREDFQAFASLKVNDDGHPYLETESEAARYIRERCCVDSRAQLDHFQGAAQEFAHIKREFLDWRR